LFCLP